MRTKLGLSAAFLFVALGAIGFYVWLDTAPSSVPHGSPSPDFGWEDFNGTPHKLDQLKGQPVVIHFWAAWCAPCRDELPRLLTAARDNPGIAFIVISSDTDRAKALEFIRQSEDVAHINNLKNLFYAWDPKRIISYGLFQTALYPETIVLNVQHEMHHKFSGPTKNTGQDIVRSLSK